eukprot:scaffold11801_cov103-Skeletonema_marinoi.AAC.1
MGSCVGIMMGIRFTDSDVVVVGLDVFVMPLLGVTNPLESGSTKEAICSANELITYQGRLLVNPNQWQSVEQMLSISDRDESSSS